MTPLPYLSLSAKCNFEVLHGQFFFIAVPIGKLFESMKKRHPNLITKDQDKKLGDTLSP